MFKTNTMESGEKQRLTLQECKNEIAKRYGYNSWATVDFYQIDALNEQ
jgi:hypothetical protein